MVSTQQWYVGPGQQPVVVLDKGYDQGRRIELFVDGSSGRSDGYRLFEISHFIGDTRLLARRRVREQLPLRPTAPCSNGSAGARRSFSMAGAATPTSISTSGWRSRRARTTVTILGEGSFHQVHGGTTTNDGARTIRTAEIWHRTAATTTSCGAGRSGAPPRRSTTSAAWTVPGELAAHAPAPAAHRLARSRGQRAIAAPTVVPASPEPSARRPDLRHGRDLLA